MPRKTFAVIALASIALLSLVAVGVATAHIDPTPAKAVAGRATVVAFTVEHGCDGSPTRTLSMRMPVGLTSAKPIPKAGWKITVERGGARRSVRQVTWRGNLPDARSSRFALRLGMPNAPGRTLYFPTVQRCAKGLIRWIDLQRPGQPEPEDPAPAVKLVRSR